MQKITQKFVTEYFKKPENLRDINSSKYDFGNVLVVAGSFGMLGAAVLAATSALRSGAGVVTCAVPEGIALAAMEHFVEVMVLPVPCKTGKYFDESSVDFLLQKKCDVIALGCGLGRNPETIKFVNQIVEKIKVPMILDADALFSLKTKPVAPTIITPHEKELARLIEINSRKEACKKIAKELGVVCVLKGNKTLVSDGEEIWENTTGNSGMATAGSGDVLTGLLAGLLAQNKTRNIFDVAKVGVFLHGKAGDLVKEKHGERSLIASDLIEVFKNVGNGFKPFPTKQ